eukprot:scaffold247593_cov22-Prasinocladus_malaysianus.AAC.1
MIDKSPPERWMYGYGYKYELPGNRFHTVRVRVRVENNAGSRKDISTRTSTLVDILVAHIR